MTALSPDTLIVSPELRVATKATLNTLPSPELLAVHGLNYATLVLLMKGLPTVALEEDAIGYIRHSDYPNGLLSVFINGYEVPAEWFTFS